MMKTRLQTDRQTDRRDKQPKLSPRMDTYIWKAYFFFVFVL